MIAFAVAERPKGRHRYDGSKWAPVITAILATAENGQAVQFKRAEMMANKRRAYNSIRSSVVRRSPMGMALRTRYEHEHFYFWLEGQSDAGRRHIT